MLARVRAAILRGLEVVPVDVEADVGTGTPGPMVVVGLAGASVKEAGARVRAAIRNAGLTFPSRKVTVNLAPAGVRKEGGALDLAIAVAVLLADAGRRPPAGAAFLGELGLDGGVRHVNGLLSLARGLQRHGVERVFVPAVDAAEAALVQGLDVIPCTGLAEIGGHLLDGAPVPASAAGTADPPPWVWDGDDLAEVRGQELARRALELAAAGGHHLLMSGPPGAGKTMLARCLPGILPPLTLEEALEVTEVASVLGELAGDAGSAVRWRRPFRDPHHTVSTAGLVGGGSPLARPGDVSRAHHGVLFLDELAEFNPVTLQALRQPLEEGRVMITRSGGSVSYPARFQLVAATNPCPCGWSGDRLHPCRCTPAAVDAYRRSLSGPLLDRIDLQVHVERLPPHLVAEEPEGESSAAVAARVAGARARQLERQGKLNARLSNRDLRRLSQTRPAARQALERLGSGLTARGFQRAWRVARTAADLAGSEAVEEMHAMEALGYRLVDAAA